MFDLGLLVSSSSHRPVENYDWGTLQWLCNDAISPGSQQTVGICHIHPGMKNPIHYHPNCEEILYVIEGVGRHSFNGEFVELRAGSTARIPIGVKHNFENIGDQVLICLIVFSSGKRQTVFC